MKHEGECQEKTCHEPATLLVKIEAHVHAGDRPIEMVLGLRVCVKHVPTIDILADDTQIWDILDAWAIQGRKNLCDRTLTKVYGVPIDGDEARALRAMQEHRRRNTQ